MLSVTRPPANATDTFQHRAVGDAGRREHDVAAGEVVEMVDLLQVLDAHAGRPRLFLVVAELQLALHLAADRAKRGGREHAFGAPPLPI